MKEKGWMVLRSEPISVTASKSRRWLDGGRWDAESGGMKWAWHGLRQRVCGPMEDVCMGIRCTLLLTAAFVFTGCAGGGRYWKEEVVLPDGRVLMVERTHTLGSQFGGEISDINRPPSAVGFTVTIPLPQGGKARWEGDRSLSPLAVGLKDGAAYLAASPRTCPDYDRWGRPVPPYVFFKYANGAWHRISVVEFPEEIGAANLMVGTDSLQSVREIEHGLVSAEVIRRRNRDTSHILRNLYREGTKGWGDCIRELDAGWYRTNRN